MRPHAVKGFTEALRVELLRDKLPVSVTLIKPSSLSTPFADHARNLMDKAASVPPPRYSPELVADAILHAASHPVRDIAVGAGARAFTVGSAAMPGVADKAMARLMPPLVRSRGAKPLHDSLYEAGVGGLTESEHLRGRKFSLYTEAQKHPALTVGLGALAVVGVAAFLGRGTLARNARPLLARAIGPLLLRAAMQRPLAAAKLAVKHPRQTAKLAAALR